MGTDQPSPEPGRRPGVWNGFGHCLKQPGKRKHPNIVLQQQVTNLHGEREGAGFDTGPEQPGSVLEPSKSLEACPLPHLHITETERSSPVRRSRPLSWTAGLCATPQNRLRVPAGRFPAARSGSGRVRNVQSEERREGRGCQAPTGPSPHQLRFLCVSFSWR